MLDDDYDYQDDEILQDLIAYMADQQECPAMFPHGSRSLRTSDIIQEIDIARLSALFIEDNEWTERQLLAILEVI
ncbi:MAG: hypothetical protein DRI98_12140 [Bacteroidetes bacterium]|nr:MAG: hypothetical protein DRI98_12140 [Bacteroidota bacterium]